MRGAIIGFVVGAWLLQTQAELPSVFFITALISASLLLVVLSRAARLQRGRFVLLMAAGVSFGFAWAAMVAHHYLADELPREWEGRDVTVIGTIDSLPNYFERGVRFNFDVEQVLPTADGAVPELPGRIALSWYLAFAGEDMQKIGEVHAGERWQLTVRLRRPHGNANPHGFDYEQWLLEQNIRATGYVRPDQRLALKNERVAAFVPSFGAVVERSRGWLRDRIQRLLQDQPYAGVVVALVMGDQRAISQTDWTVFNRTGVSHLVSISGLHITMIAALFAQLTFALWRRSFFTTASLPLRLPAQKAAAIAGVAAAFVYVLLAGSGVPAQRTLCMLSVVALALWFGRITNVSHVLCLALGAVVLKDPWAVLGAGFWLSFGAVGVILYATVGRAQTVEQRARPHWRIALETATRTQYAVTLGLVPLTVLLFGQASLVSPFANAIAIPLVSFLVTPLSLVGSVLPAPLAGWCLWLAHWMIEWLARLLHWMSALPAAVWIAPIPSWWMFALAVIGTLWMLAPRGWPMRWLGLFAWLPLVLNAPLHPRAGEMWVTAFDVGQGMAVLVETPNHRLLYDTGPAYSPEADGGNRVVLPYLRARGIHRLDGVIVTHSDTDHSGGALSIFADMQIGWTASSLPSAHPVVQQAPAHRPCVAGQTWEWDGVRFEMLHPTPEIYQSERWKPNARSCTLKITSGRHAILLPGDIEAQQEAELVRNFGSELHADVLLAPHHGSGTSSTWPFLRTVAPQIAIFQVGYRNRYGHPKQEIVERYGELGVRRLRSDAAGAISVRFGEGIEVGEYRREHARYWYGR
ncbi:DNA internalization-related competence protein ComEC/Rec2 [Oxalicibacterium flavum]|uniref:DNA internalization-related competence protein ComEC/Rec2 n=1 Tax=Oxalicibacterium flavum TaxID=179467 RepID=A0A8J2UQM8_9BURK|nr:DNA internalization-related competence protein ComEC/Rec2 [Oxalicibacterium flavum]GGC17499.1 DNA internalization-related competence protein ComEC/Rec2 [Oxalicibacterium flavum]